MNTFERLEVRIAFSEDSDFLKLDSISWSDSRTCPHQSSKVLSCYKKANAPSSKLISEVVVSIALRGQLIHSRLDALL